MENDVLSTVSLFTGIGGMDFGFEAAGFQTRVALEFDGHCAAALAANRPEWAVIHDDIHRVSGEDVMSRGQLSPGECDLLIGGPPCQPFSKSGYWSKGDAGRLNDPRSHTLAGYLRMVADLQPSAFVLENVAGLAFTGKDEGLQYILDGAKGINAALGTNYVVSYKVLNAADYGVPQKRERIFLVASKFGKAFKFPEATHGEGSTDLFTGRKAAFTTAWDAIGDLEALPNSSDLIVGGKWGKLLPSIPEGENYLWHTDAGGGEPLFGYRTRYWSFLLKLAKNMPSWTIQAQPGSAIGPFHWKNRKLSFHEMCRLQTFPDGLSVSSGRTEQQRMVGNAVPSLLAEVLGREIRRQFFGHHINHELRLLPPSRGPVPAPEPITSVAPQYLDLVGSHEAHRTVKGPVRKKRADVRR